MSICVCVYVSTDTNMRARIQILSMMFFSSVQFSHFCNPMTAASQASLSVTNYWSLLKLMSIKLVMPSNHVILSCPLLLQPSIFPSIQVFSTESVFPIRWPGASASASILPMFWSFSFSISPSSGYSGLISFQFSSVQSLNRVRLFASP